MFSQKEKDKQQNIIIKIKQQNKLSPLVLSTSYVPPTSSHTAQHSIFNKYLRSYFTAKISQIKSLKRSNIV